MEPDIDPRMSKRVAPMELAASQRATSQKSPTKRTSKALDLKKTEKLNGGRGVGSSPTPSSSASRRSDSRVGRTASLSVRTGPAGGSVFSRTSLSSGSSSTSSSSSAACSKGAGDWLTRSRSPLVESESFRRGNISTSSSPVGAAVSAPPWPKAPTGPVSSGNTGAPFIVLAQGGSVAVGARASFGGVSTSASFSARTSRNLSIFSLPSSMVFPIPSSSWVSKVTGIGTASLEASASARSLSSVMYSMAGSVSSAVEGSSSVFPACASSSDRLAATSAVSSSTGASDLSSLSAGSSVSSSSSSSPSSSSSSSLFSSSAFLSSVVSSFSSGSSNLPFPPASAALISSTRMTSSVRSSSSSPASSATSLSRANSSVSSSSSSSRSESSLGLDSPSGSSTV